VVVRHERVACRGVRALGVGGGHAPYRWTTKEVAMDRNQRLTLSVTEAAELLGISRALAYELVARGELPSLQFGRRLVVPWRAIERLLASCENTAAPEAQVAGVGQQLSDLDQPFQTSEHHPQPRTQRDGPTKRTTYAEPESERSISTANSRVPNPTHTLASGMRRRTKPRTERVPPRRSS
jgi:excisionase family DNA binding protein